MDTSPAPIDEGLAPRPRRRRGELPLWVTVLVFTLLAGAGVGVWYFGTRPANGIRLENVQADISQTLPVGSTRDEVKAWLAAREFTDTKEITDGGGKVDGIQVTIPNDTWFDQADIVLHIRFDRDWKLRSVIASRLFRN